MAIIKDSGPVAARLRALRKERGWTLDEVAERSGISKATLSKLENGRTNLSFTTVSKLSEGLRVPIALLTNPTLSNEGSRRSISRHNQNATFVANDSTWEILCNDLTGHDQVYLKATIQRHELDETEAWRKHPGQEFLYVLSGTLILYSESYEPLTLNPGDSIAFDSSMGHKYVSASDEDAVILLTMQAAGYTDLDDGFQ